MQSYYITDERVFQDANWLRKSYLPEKAHMRDLLLSLFSELHQEDIIRAILVATIV